MKTILHYWEIFYTAMKLGLTSFGGPIAHLGYFREVYVIRKNWLSEKSYVDLIALCQFLPGPASSQVGMGIGWMRGGFIGSILSWLGFTLPSAILLIVAGWGMREWDLESHNHWIHGLKIAAVAVVAHAVLGMGKKLCPDKERIAVATISTTLILLVKIIWMQIIVIFLSGVVGWFFLREKSNKQNSLNLESNDLLKFNQNLSGNLLAGMSFIGLFIFFLFALPGLRILDSDPIFQYIDSFYRAGSLVFGGGHVVLPLLESEVVDSGWISKDLFLAGYGLANAVPGPLFTFSAYLGAAFSHQPNEWLGGFICLFAIFLPSFFLVWGVLPFWERLQSNASVQNSLRGINAGVVGILLAALYDPIWTSAIFSPRDFATALLGFVMLEFWKIPSWLIVCLAVVFSFI